MLDDKTPVGKLYKMELDESDDFADVDIGSLIKPEYFERLIPAVKKAQADFPLTPYVDSKKIAALKKGLNEYNQNVPKVNKLAQDKFKIQNELKASGLTPGSPSYLRVSDELAEIDKQIADLVPPESFGNFSGFTLTKADLEQATGKPFTESLGKSVDEIFYDLEYLRGGNTGPIRQKYGPGTPEERALKYFNEMVNNTEQTFDIGNGLGILKKATKINPDLLKGYAIDPYAKGARSDVTKFPIRSNFLRAVTEGKDGMYLDSATKRLGKEGGSQYDILQTTYKEAENEIAKIIKELGEDPKKYVRTFNKVDADLDGTYVKIDDEIRKLVIDKGVDAFKDGGPVNIENMLANL
jgi:Txe/YoeB family toxin of Txe-Axe toxin-antitoxin module